MSDCKFSRELLYAWIDDEAGEASNEVDQHVRQCAECAREVEDVRATGNQLRALVRDAVGEVEPLVALREIRARVEERESRSFWATVTLGWESLWESHRRAVLGVAFAFALGALTSPLVMWWSSLEEADRPGAWGDPRTASVRVESVEIEGGARTVVLQPQGSSTAVIWIDSGDGIEHGPGQ